MNLRKDIGARIKSIRENSKLTQEEFAEIVKVDVAFLSGIENGHRNITLDTLDKLLTALNSNLLNILFPVKSEMIQERKEYIDTIIASVQEMDLDTLRVLSTFFRKK